MLDLPITTEAALSQIVVPALSALPAKMDSDSARVQLIAIALQESGLKARRQLGNGPARGLWQFEKGGISGVLNHKASRPLLLSYCAARSIPTTAVDILSLLETSDELACVVARLLLWTDINPLPALGDADDAWDYYVRNWRPGHPRVETWHDNYRLALAAVSKANE